MYHKRRSASIYELYYSIYMIYPRIYHFDETVLYYHLYLKIEKDYPVVA